MTEGAGYPGSAIPGGRSARLLPDSPTRRVGVSDGWPLSSGTQTQSGRDRGSAGAALKRDLAAGGAEPGPMRGLEPAGPEAHRPGSPRRSRSPRGEQRPSLGLCLCSQGPRLARKPTCRGAQVRGQAANRAGLLQGLRGSAGAADGGCGGPKVALAGGARSPRARPSRERKTGPGRPSERM